MNSEWVLHKFGGSSLESAECYFNVAKIISSVADRRIAVVVSAMGGKPKITDLLLSAVHSAANGNTADAYESIVCIEKKHTNCVNLMFGRETAASESLLTAIVSDLKDITDVLKAVSIMKQAPVQILELVSGYGEIWSTNILSTYMQTLGLSFGMVNAREVLFVSEQDVGIKVHWTESKIKLNDYLISQCSHCQHLVITGYIASNLQGVATTLKRDGSDFSASIFARLLQATSITIWTDVSGIYSADPNKVEDAKIVPRMSYSEATELAYFGAKVLHPNTMAPAIDANIPIRIRNTFRPSDPGTEISLVPSSAAGDCPLSVCGFTTINNLVLMNIEGTGMMGVPGIAHRLFGALKGASISVMFIAQASSEHSICFVTAESHSDAAKRAVEEVFHYELRQGVISSINVVKECSILAVVGESMSNVPGVAGKFFTALGMAGISVLSIAQGCDERNISAVIRTKDAVTALRAVHSAFKLVL